MRDAPAGADPYAAVGVGPKSVGIRIVPNQPVSVIQVPPEATVQNVHALVAAEPNPAAAVASDKVDLPRPQPVFAREVAPARTWAIEDKLRHADRFGIGNPQRTVPRLGQFAHPVMRSEEHTSELQSL